MSKKKPAKKLKKHESKKRKGGRASSDLGTNCVEYSDDEGKEIRIEDAVSISLIKI